MKKIGNLLVSFLIGVGIGSLVELIVSFFIGKITIGVPEYVMSQTSPVLAHFKSLMLYGGYGIVGTLSGSFYDKEKTSLLAATVINLASLLIYHSFVGLYLKWFNLNTLIQALIVFTINFFIIWSIIYFFEKKNIEKINKKLSNKKETE
ncbi:DUF3021 family protein [Peptoniphilus obesi]|uniref:DUF3021 family protein n=1 Tax=Peptoniphilus obesi TaxID=1472765 RepID=UPI0004B002FA|nr:DUF3021 family protein [Peptoniphilus obesi]